MPVTTTRLLTVWASKWLKLGRSIASGLHLFDHHRQPVTEIAGEQAAFAELLPQGFARRGMEVDAQAGSIEQRMEIFLDAMEQSAIAGGEPAAREELVSDAEIDRMILADVIAAEKQELSKLDELESEIAKELGVAKQRD